MAASPSVHDQVVSFWTTLVVRTQFLFQIMRNLSLSCSSSSSSGASGVATSAALALALLEQCERACNDRQIASSVFPFGAFRFLAIGLEEDAPRVEADDGFFFSRPRVDLLPLPQEAYPRRLRLALSSSSSATGRLPRRWRCARWVMAPVWVS